MVNELLDSNTLLCCGYFHIKIFELLVSACACVLTKFINDVLLHHLHDVILSSVGS